METVKPVTAALILLSGLFPFCLGEEEQEPLTYDQIVLSSRCRASCIGKYVGLTTSDAKCIANMNCYKCWGMCENLLRPSWEYMCLEKQRHVCNDGCQLACDFMKSQRDTETVAHDSDLWGFPDAARRSIESDTLLKVTWPGAVREDWKGTAVVYTVMWTFDQADSWSPVCTTTEMWADIDGPHYQFPGLDFLILAITSDGLVTETVPMDETQKEHESEIPSPAESTPLSVHVNVVGNLLEGIVSWELPGGHRAGDYQIRWGRDNCECETPRVSATQVLSKYMEPGKLVTFDMSGLTFNSKYWVEIELNQGMASRVYFYTPACENTDSSCTRCSQASQVFKALNTINTESGPLIAEPVSTFTIVGFCVVCSGAVVAMAIVLSCKHKQLMATLTVQAQNIKTRSASFRASFRSRTSSVRSSMRSRLNRQADSPASCRPLDIETNSPSATSLLSNKCHSSDCFSDNESLPPTPPSYSDDGNSSPTSNFSFPLPPPLATITEVEESES